MSKLWIGDKLHELDDDVIDEIDTLRSEVRRIRANNDRAWDYAADLQRIIQTHCRGDVIEPELAAKSPFLAGELNRALPK